MKKLLLLLLIPVFQFLTCQIYFGPQLNHGYESYTATINGNGTIYYTTDGTDPTVNSPSGVNQVNINISEITKVKAILKDNSNQFSQMFTQSFYFGQFPYKTVYFKKPASWTNVCSFSNSYDPQTTFDVYSGPSMTSVCEGWYKADHAFFVGSVTFDNCASVAPPLYQYFNIITEKTVYYDYSSGPITNPPACLLAVNETKKIAMVKVFPNPVQDLITIESEKKFISYEIIDFNGKIIDSGTFSNPKIDVSRLTYGNYIIKLTSLSSATDYVKFIKK